MLATSPYPNVQALFDDCLLAAIDQVLERVAPGGAIYSKELFETARDRVSGVVMDSMFDTVALVNRILTGARDAERAIKAATSMQLIGALTDAREQLAGLVHPGFVSATGLARLQRLPAYLSGLTHRVQRLPDQPARDRAWMTEVQKATDLYREAGGIIPSAPHAPESLVHARWMLEELRLSLFAQHLPTAEPVSLQRIRKVLAG